MDAETETVAAKVLGARVAEDVFGAAADEAGVTTAFRAMARILHPDRAGDSKRAQDATARLLAFRDEAEKKFRAKTWGKRLAGTPVRLQAKNTYEDVRLLAPGDTCDVYEADFKEGGTPRVAAIKLVREPRDADLSANEWKILGDLWALKDDAAKWFQRYLARPVETARIQVGGKIRRANVFRKAEHRITMAHVMEVEPDGLDPRDMVWMWRRLLEVSAWLGQQGVVHGALIPEHVLIDPEDHSARLVGWSGAVRVGQTVKILSAKRKDWYAPEIPSKLPATGATDVYGAARLALGLVGMDRTRLPPKMKALLDACLLRNPRMRHTDALEVYKRLDAVTRDAFGPPKFRPLVLRGA